ncbi:hypothetical protein [Micromonospora sp. WMMA1996]|uniref:hypothetical protein n=1 Tax=Micromonospora sp. WMMA1996 TaxID=2039878 RepID=UPI0020D27D54|nr:hypothetical protein [Micromonospora sp. WMMA1996]
MTTAERRPDDVPTGEARVDEALRLLSGVPVELDVPDVRTDAGAPSCREALVTHVLSAPFASVRCADERIPD